MTSHASYAPWGHLKREGRAVVTPKQISLVGTSAATVIEAGSGILGLELNGGHVCYVSDIDFRVIAPNP